MRNRQSFYQTLAIVDNFSSAPFRIFFITACISLVCSSIYSSLTLAYTQAATLNHTHYFFLLQSFAGAVYGGFLFTAIPRKTKDAVPLKHFMQHLWVLWLAATSSALVSVSIALCFMLLYWLYILILAAWLMYRKQNWSQFNILVFVAFTLLATVYPITQIWNKPNTNTQIWQPLWYLEIIGVTLLVLRISKLLGSQALADSQIANSTFVPNIYYKNATVYLLYLAILVYFFVSNRDIEGWLNFAIAGVILGRLRDLHFTALLKQHYIRWIYLALLSVGVGFAYRGALLVGFMQGTTNQANAESHAITISCIFSVYQLFVVAGLWHSKQKIHYPISIRTSLLSILLASVLYALSSHITSNISIYLANSCILLASLAYITVFARIFIRHPAAAIQTAS